MYEQFVVVERPVEVEVGKFAQIADRRVVGTICHLLNRQGLLIGEDERHDLVDDVPCCVAEDTLVVRTEDEFEYAVRITPLLLEGQIRHQSHLVANGCVSGELLDERFGQRLLEECELVDVSVHTCATEEHISADDRQSECLSDGDQFGIEIDRQCVVCSVDDDGDVVPCVVVDRRSGEQGIGNMHRQVTVVHGDEQSALALVVVYPSGGEEMSVGSGSEPEHIRCIVRSGA